MKKNINTVFISFLLLISLAACGEQKVHQEILPTLTQKIPETAELTTEDSTDASNPQSKPIIDMKKCVCVQLWMPVCGENGKTYSNSCFAKCADIKFKQGSCAKIITD